MCRRPLVTSQQSLYRGRVSLLRRDKTAGSRTCLDTRENASCKSRRVVHKGLDHAYLAARRGRKDRLELRGGDKRAGVLTGLAAIVVEGVPKLSGTMRLTV